MLFGGKIKTIAVPEFDTTLSNSFAYVPTSLANFPAVVGLPNINKGDFSHLFSRRENWNKIVAFSARAEFD